MINQTTQNVLKVFLASPGDLVEERKVVGSAVDSINRSIRKIGWHIELFVWEDTLPGYGRPQEIINPDVDKCDLFVGLLWKRWGQSTGGDYESGFEEEFERAITRRRKTNSPQIWIIFKKLTPEDKIDIGEQRKKVLQFRQKLEESNELKYQEFEDISDFKDKIKDWLREYVDNIALPNLLALQGPLTESQLVPQLTESPSPISSAEIESKQPALSQLLDIMNRFSKKINTEKLDFLQDQNIDKLNITRLFLFASVFMSKNCTRELFGVHEVNIFYSYRKQLELTSEEKYQLHRAMISNYKSNVIPGWFWDRDFTLTDVERSLLFPGFHDGNDGVRKRAFELIGSAKIKPTSFSFEEIAQRCSNDTSEQVRKTGWNYLSMIGELEDIAGIEKYLESEKSDVQAEASQARLMIIARSDPNRALSEIISTKHTNVEYLVKKEIEKQSEAISEDLLFKALSHPDEKIRLLVLNELAARDKISEEQMSALLKDSSIKIREYCFKKLIKKGKKFKTEEIKEALKDRSSTGLGGFLSEDLDPDEVILIMYQQIPPEELFALIDWFSLDGQIAYKALAIYHFDKISDNIRINLSTNFEVLKQESREKIVMKCGEEAAVSLFKYDEKLDNFIRAQFTSAALAGLAVNGEPSDIQIGRRFLKDSDRMVRLEAVKIVNRFGDASDAEILIEIAKEGYGELIELAVNTALKLSPGIDGAASILLQIKDASLVGFAIRTLLDEEVEKVVQKLEPLLNNDNDNIREKVLAYFCRKYNKEKLEELLNEYLEKPSYYYNVVCWLDRILYAPPPLKEVFIQELKSKIHSEQSEGNVLLN